MLTYGEERALLEDIQEGIAIAMDRQGASADQIDPIKVNKLAYFAIREFDLGITFGWYKYGPAPVDVADHTTSGTSIQIEPRSHRDIMASDRSRVPSEKHAHPSPEQYADFFDGFEEFEIMLSTPTREYLMRFYEEFAPNKYSGLYEASINLQLTLDDISSSPEWSEHGEQLYEELALNFNQLYRELLQISELDESIDSFKDYKTLTKNIISEAARQGDLTEHQQRFISQVVGFFYQNTWRYIALLISKDTVTGENTNRLRNSIDDDLSQIRLYYGENLVQLAENSRLFGLRPKSRRQINQAEELERQTPDHDFEVDQISLLGSEAVYR